MKKLTDEEVFDLLSVDALQFYEDNCDIEVYFENDKYFIPYLSDFEESFTLAELSSLMETLGSTEE